MITVALKSHPRIDVEQFAVALQEQATCVATAWSASTPHLAGGVTVVPYHRQKPAGAWRVQFYDQLPPGMGGVHLGTTQHPYAKVLTSEGSVAASHEVCEMLVDPAGTRFASQRGREYLVELCDPVEGDTYSGLGGVELSDFIMPAFYDLAGTTYDYLGLLHAPVLTLRPTGYISWIEAGSWWQAYADGNGHISQRRIGTAKARNRREKDRLARAADRAET